MTEHDWSPGLPLLILGAVVLVLAVVLVIACRRHP
jgi:hypothetical protein